MMRERMYRIATGLILLGFVLLCQPFLQVLFSIGFPTLVAGVIMHIVLDHWPWRIPVAEEDT